MSPLERRRRRRPFSVRVTGAHLVVGVVLCVGLAGTVVGLRNRQGDSQFSAAQQSLGYLTAAQLESLMRTSHDARPDHRDAIAISAACSAAPDQQLDSRWTCSVRYPRGRVSYAVVVRRNGGIDAIGGSGLTFHGCCVGPPKPRSG